MTPPSQPLISVWFVVTGMTDDPHNCTQHLGIEPTEVLTKGDGRPGKRPAVPHSSWSLKTRKEKLNSKDKALQILLNRIWLKRRQIKSHVKKRHLTITFVVCVTGSADENVLYHLSTETIRRIGYFSAPLYFDIY